MGVPALRPHDEDLLVARGTQDSLVSDLIGNKLSSISDDTKGVVLRFHA
jgi:hypothetical protein